MQNATNKLLIWATMVAFALVLAIGVNAQEAPPPEEGQLCDDTCPSANDGECDDGGEGSVFALCPLGTDCTDCGPRDSE